MSKKITLIFAVLFFAVMIFLTFFAEDIHNASIPNVRVGLTEYKSFLYQKTVGGYTTETMVQRAALPESVVQNGVYTVYSLEKNGSKRNFVRLVPVQTGVCYEGWIEIVSGLSGGERVVVETDKDLTDGCEVALIK